MNIYKNLYVDRLGVHFSRKGDIIIWIWPWKRKNLPKYLSILFSGTGENGDARFKSLREIDKALDDYPKDLFDTYR